MPGNVGGHVLARFHFRHPLSWSFQITQWWNFSQTCSNKCKYIQVFQWTTSVATQASAWITLFPQSLCFLQNGFQWQISSVRDVLLLPNYMWTWYICAEPKNWIICPELKSKSLLLPVHLVAYLVCPVRLQTGIPSNVLNLNRDKLSIGWHQFHVCWVTVLQLLSYLPSSWWNMDTRVTLFVLLMRDILSKTSLENHTTMLLWWYIFSLILNSTFF